jgi:hypothetical protein
VGEGARAARGGFSADLKLSLSTVLAKTGESKSQAGST